MSLPSTVGPYSPFPGLGLVQGVRSLLGPVPNVQSRCGPGEVIGFHQARGALRHALRARSVGPGDRVLVPAYHCGVEVAAILDLGAAVDYYSIASTFQSDPGDIRRRAAPTTRAILVIHYFGFTQPIDPIVEICREKGWILIEDCAHSLCVHRAGGRVGRVGDLALYSLPKTLPVPDGGLLRVNRGPAPAEPAVPPRPLPVARQIVRLALSGLRSGRNPIARAAGRGLEKAVRLASAAARTSSVSEELSEWNPAGEGFRPEMARYGLSDFSRRLLSRVDFEAAAAARRGNYVRLARRLLAVPESGMCLPDLPEDACPMVFPVRSTDREPLASDLLRRGVGTFVFGKSLHPTLDRAEFPDACALSDSILGLPIHQNLDDRAIDEIAGAYLASIEGPVGGPAGQGEAR